MTGDRAAEADFALPESRSDELPRRSDGGSTDTATGRRPSVTRQTSRSVAIKGVGYVVGLVAVRVVNAWFYATPLDVFVQRTVLMILLGYGIAAFRRRWLERRMGHPAAHQREPLKRPLG
jgi:hypothetical protein